MILLVIDDQLHLMEKQIYERDDLVENLSNRISEMEIKLLKILVKNYSLLKRNLETL